MDQTPLSLGLIADQTPSATAPAIELTTAQVTTPARNRSNKRVLGQGVPGNRMNEKRMDMQVKDKGMNVEAMLLDVIPHLRAFARSLTRNRDQADDLTHDAVVRALAAIDQFTPGTNFKAWMFTILRNLYYNECRKRWIKSTPIDEMAGDEPSIGPAQEANLEFNDFRRAFWQLNADQREVLILVGASGFSYEEAAEVCNCRVGTVKSRVSRARAELKQILELGTLPGTRQDALQAPPDGLDEFLTRDTETLPDNPTPSKD